MGFNNYMKGCIRLISYSLYLIANSSFAQDNSKAIELFKSGQYNNAIDAFNLHIKANKNDTIAYIYRRLSKESIKDFSGARSDFEKLVKFLPQDATLHFRLGVLWS